MTSSLGAKVTPSSSKIQTAPITDDEWLIRLVWEDFVKPNRVPIISPKAFQPRPKEVEGISCYRLACLSEPADALLAIAEDKQRRYAIVQISVKLLTELGLTVQIDANEIVPGHVLVPEININADRAWLAPIRDKLANMASENILRWAGAPATS